MTLPSVSERPSCAAEPAGGVTSTRSMEIVLLAALLRIWNVCVPAPRPDTV
jgi:hypothetical protein